MAAIESEYAWLEGEGKDLVAFTAAWSGGADAKFIHNVLEYNRMLKNAGDPPGAVLAALARIQLVNYPEVVVAMLKTMLSAPQQYVGVINKATIIQLGDVQQMTSLKIREMMLATRSYIKQFSEYTAKLNAASTADVAKAKGDLEVG